VASKQLTLRLGKRQLVQQNNRSLRSDSHNRYLTTIFDTGENKMNDTTAPLITAVIPTRGRAGLVARAVRSALHQTYPHVEVIVVVDGPDEATLEALKAIEEQRLRVIALAENVGGSEARNIGVRAARGTWIALLDDDDQWFSEKLATQIAVADLSARHFLVTCRRLERQPGRPDVLAPRRGLRPGEHVSEYMFYPEDKRHHLCGPQTSSFLATKELFLDVPFSKGLRCHQDWDWYLRVMHNERTVALMVDEPLYVMDVEPERPRMTQIAKWHFSLDWVESRKNLFTLRAYRSVLINECMFRCEETTHRTRIFKELLSLCQQSGKLRGTDWIAIAKWYLFRPSVRLRLRRYQRQIKASLWGGFMGIRSIERLPNKQEAHD
jgi:glycosyltransferase involved in cell wall biosynthesis